MTRRFSWVDQRARCNLSGTLQQLTDHIRNDTDQVNERVGTRRYTVTRHGNRLELQDATNNSMLTVQKETEHLRIRRELTNGHIAIWHLQPRWDRKWVRCQLWMRTEGGDGWEPVEIDEVCFVLLDPLFFPRE